MTNNSKDGKGLLQYGHTKRKAPFGVLYQNAIQWVLPKTLFLEVLVGLIDSYRLTKRE